jgi:hypothetical protein
MEFRIRAMEFQNRKDRPAFGNEDEMPAFGNEDEMPAFGNEDEMPAFGNEDEMPAFHRSNLKKDGSPNDDDPESLPKNMVPFGKKSERGNLLVC